LKDYPPFNPGHAFLAPAVVENVAELAGACQMTMDRVRTEFLKIGCRVQGAIHTPLSAEEAWPKLEAALQEGQRDSNPCYRREGVPAIQLEM
jgi:hypothetical protein